LGSPLPPPPDVLEWLNEEEARKFRDDDGYLVRIDETGLKGRDIGTQEMDSESE
jgi:hypothetical protein